MSAAKKFIVGWRAFIPPTSTKQAVFLGVGRDLIPASSVEAAMKLALRIVPMRIHQPGCNIAIRYCREKKDG